MVLTKLHLTLCTYLSKDHVLMLIKAICKVQFIFKWWPANLSENHTHYCVVRNELKAMQTNAYSLDLVNSVSHIFLDPIVIQFLSCPQHQVWILQVFITKLVQSKHCHLATTLLLTVYETGLLSFFYFIFFKHWATDGRIVFYLCTCCVQPFSNAILLT